MVRYRKRAASNSPSQVRIGPPALVNLDTVSIDSHSKDSKVFATAQKQQLKSADKFEKSSTNTQPTYMNMDFNICKEDWSLISSTPNVNTLPKAKCRKFTSSGTFHPHETTLVGPILENVRLSSEVDSVTFSLEEKVVSEHSFEHFSHRDLESRCTCECGLEEAEENQTFII